MITRSYYRSSRRTQCLRHNLTGDLPARRRMAQRHSCTRRPEPPHSEQERARLDSRRRGERERLKYEGDHPVVAFNTGEGSEAIGLYVGIGGWPPLYEADYRHGERRRDWVGAKRCT